MLLNKADDAKTNTSATVSGISPVESTTVPSVRTDDSSVTAPSSTSSSSHSSSASVHPPQLSKVTAFEFMQAWNGLKGTTDIEQYVNVLDQIQPSDISKGTSVMWWILLNFSIP